MLFVFVFLQSSFAGKEWRGRRVIRREGAGSAMKRLVTRSSAPPPLFCVALLVVAKLLTAQAPGM